MSRDEIVDAWFLETFHGQPLTTDLFNRFNAARDALKARLASAEAQWTVTASSSWTTAPAPGGAAETVPPEDDPLTITPREEK